MKTTKCLLFSLLGIGGLINAQETESLKSNNHSLTPKVMNNTGATRIPYQGNVGIGTERPAVRLDVAGYLRLGSEDPAGDANPVPGMLRYNKDTKKFQGYVGGTNPGWRDLH